MNPEQFLTQFLAQFTYVGVFLVLLCSGFGVPIPEDVPLLLGGVMCSPVLAYDMLGIEPLALAAMIPLCFVAVVGGDMTIYYLGRCYGHHVPKFPLVRRFLTPHRLQRAEEAFHRHAGKTLAVARFLPGLRTPAFFTAGTFRIPWWKMLAFDGGAAMVSVPLWVCAGYYLGQSMRQITAYSRVIGAVAVVCLVGLAVLYRLWHKRGCPAGK
jgi:membrane protein DedA with SNARE-associated domain